jgi:hypothetical protein
MIQCGSYTGNGSTDGPEIDLGWEPQYLLVKQTDANGYWNLSDVMRGIATGGTDAELYADLANSEVNDTVILDVTPNGFAIKTSSNSHNAANGNYIYMAIRRPNKPAEEFEADELFAMFRSNNIGSMGGPPGFRSGFPVDMAFWTTPDGGGTAKYIGDRLNQGSHLYTHETDSAYTSGTLPDNFKFDYNNGYYSDGNAQYFSWMWRRAPGFFDVVCYEGNKPANTLINHNLQVAPEFMIVKNRTADNGSWVVQHSGLTNGIGQGASSTSYCYLNSANGEDASEAFNFAPTSTTFTLASQNSQINDTVSPIRQYIAYLFASVPGICDIGSYTGTASTQDIDCGFTTGARFILIKRTDVSGNWTFWDTERGISSGNDPFLALNDTGAQNNSMNVLTPLSSGFTVNADSANYPVINANGGTYIYMAIA